MGLPWGFIPPAGQGKYPLKEWEEAVSYLLGCEVHFENYESIGKSLKPFSLQVR